MQAQANAVEYKSFNGHKLQSYLMCILTFSSRLPFFPFPFSARAPFLFAYISTCTFYSVRLPDSVRCRLRFALPIPIHLPGDF